MDKIAELENQIKVEKDRLSNLEVEETLDSMRKNMVGKFYSSHLLNRYMGSKKAFEFSVMHVKDVKYDKGGYTKYLYVADRVEVRRNISITSFYYWNRR